jgi:hypothetical protein
MCAATQAFFDDSGSYTIDEAGSRYVPTHYGDDIADGWSQPMPNTSSPPNHGRSILRVRRMTGTVKPSIPSSTQASIPSSIKVQSTGNILSFFKTQSKSVATSGGALTIPAPPPVVLIPPPFVSGCGEDLFPDPFAQLLKAKQLSGNAVSVSSLQQTTQIAADSKSSPILGHDERKLAVTFPIVLPPDYPRNYPASNCNDVADPTHRPWEPREPLSVQHEQYKILLIQHHQEWVKKFNQMWSQIHGSERTRILLSQLDTVSFSLLETIVSYM